MPLVNPKNIIFKAKKENKAVGSFNVLNLEMIRAVIEAAEEKNTPVILQISQGAIRWAKFKYIVPAALSGAKEAKVDIGVHFDHATEVDFVKKAINWGFTSVMYDGSHSSYEENVKNSLEVKKMVLNKNIATEFEIGKVGGKEDDLESSESEIMSVEMVKDFYNKTKPDFLAIGFGTSHGIYKGPINLDYDLIEKCSKELLAPLVMHGSSGVDFSKISKAIKLGITKVNVGTDLLIENFKAIKKYLVENPNEYNIRKINEDGIIAIKVKVKEYIDLFNS